MTEANTPRKDNLPGRTEILSKQNSLLAATNGRSERSCGEHWPEGDSLRVAHHVGAVLLAVWPAASQQIVRPRQRLVQTIRTALQ